MAVDYLALMRYLADSTIPYRPRFKLPHTILYTQSSIEQWIFTDRNGVIRKKHKKSITRQNVEKVFLHGHERTGVVAFFIWESDGDIETELEYASTGYKILYLNKTMFLQVLDGKFSIRKGLLQKFVDPHTTKHSTIEVVWTRYLSTFLQHTNKKHLHSQQLDIYERCCTFDGPPYFSESCSLKGLIAKLLQEEIELMVRRLNELTCRSLECDSLVCHFKRSYNGDLHFLFASVKEVTGKEALQDMQNVSIPVQISTANRQRARDRKKVRCGLCMSMKESDAFITNPFCFFFKDSDRELVERARKLLPVNEFQLHEQDEEQNFIAGEVDTQVTICDDCFLRYVPDVSNRYHKRSERTLKTSTVHRSRVYSSRDSLRTPLRTFSSFSTERKANRLQAQPTSDRFSRWQEQKNERQARNTLRLQVEMLKKQTRGNEGGKLKVLEQILDSVRFKK